MPLTAASTSRSSGAATTAAMGDHRIATARAPGRAGARVFGDHEHPELLGDVQHEGRY